MAQTKMSAAEKLHGIACETGDTFRPDYSGRGMYGTECVGIVTGNPNEIIAMAGKRGIRGAVTDSMGKGTIVYWPKVQS